MNYITLTEFIEDIEGVIDATVQIEEFTHIETEKGNVVLISEDTFESLMQMIANRKHVYKEFNSTGSNE